MESGLLGLTRYNDPDYRNFIDLAFQQGSISSRVFAIYLADSTEQSTLQVGGYDPSYLMDPSVPINFVQLADSTIFWDIQIDAVRVGKNDFNATGGPAGWTFYSSIGRLDTGTSIMYVPSSLYE